MQPQLPPGSRLPKILQTIGWWARTPPYLERLRRRYGSRFTMRLLGQPPFVVLSDPADLRELFTAPPDVLHPGEGARLLEPVVGPNSVILLDEDAAPGAAAADAARVPRRPHAAPRRAHGGPHRAGGRALAGRRAASPLHPRLQRLTLEIILRAVFGLDEGPRLERLRDLLTAILEFGESPLSLLPAAQRLLSGRGRFGRFERDRAEVDAELFALMDERRREGPSATTCWPCCWRPARRRHADGRRGDPRRAASRRSSPATRRPRRRWRSPSSSSRVRRTLQEPLASGDDAYLEATINEVLRRRPVLPNPEPRLVDAAGRDRRRDLPARASC